MSEAKPELKHLNKQDELLWKGYQELKMNDEELRHEFKAIAEDLETRLQKRHTVFNDTLFNLSSRVSKLEEGFFQKLKKWFLT